MNHAQKYLAQANRHIAELTVQIARQRVIVRHALDTGQRSEMAESLLDALEGSLRIFEKHRTFLLSCSVNRPSKRIIRASRPADAPIPSQGTNQGKARIATALLIGSRETLHPSDNRHCASSAKNSDENHVAASQLKAKN